MKDGCSMSAKYILRLDDACPTMDRKKWQKVEDICDKYNIKPIVAVIPNNKDSQQKKDEYDENFWDKVRSWQVKGWHIALHGYDHVYISNDSGLVPFNNDSEFAGLSYEKQAQKIREGWKILQENGINANIWVAPSHTFDKNTLKALKENTTINIVSDGIALFPFKKYGFNWIPQQVWRFRKMPFGIWTGCFHPNEMSEKEFRDLDSFMEENYQNFIDIKVLKYKSFSILNLILIFFNQLIF